MTHIANNNPAKRVPGNAETDSSVFGTLLGIRANRGQTPV
jgi:hypothetical protein